MNFDNIRADMDKAADTSKTERVILGIDPGTAVMGYGLICEKGKKLELITLGVIHLAKYDSHALKLKKIFERCLGLIDEYHPDCMAIEDPFFGKNVQVMLKLGRAQGVAMAAALHRDVPIMEYSPKKIKQSITGKGNATKEQVAAMLKQLLKFTEGGSFLDATDGLAVAVCHAFQRFDGSDSSKKSYSGWDTFVKDNPGKLKKTLAPGIVPGSRNTLKSGQAALVSEFARIGQAALGVQAVLGIQAVLGEQAALSEQVTLAIQAAPEALPAGTSS